MEGVERRGLAPAVGSLSASNDTSQAAPPGGNGKPWATRQYPVFSGVPAGEGTFWTFAARAIV